jgi:acyl-CoA dehydrogenase
MASAAIFSPRSTGPKALSLIVVDGDTPGLTRVELKKTGWWASDTAQLFFADCRVPVGNLVGEEGEGFKAIMRNFNHERLVMAASSVGYAQACTEEALAWARQRHTFGQALVQHQVIRHKLIDMWSRVEAARSFVHELGWRLQHGAGDAAALVARTCMAKVLATQAMAFCASEAVQILGGAGFMRGSKSERLLREVKVMAIGGGSEEILKDLAARQLGV